MNTQDPFVGLRSRFPQHISQIDLVDQMARTLRYNPYTQARIARWFKKGHRWHEIEEANKLGFLDKYVRGLADGRDDFYFLYKDAKRYDDVKERATPFGIRGFLFRVASAGTAIARSIGFL